MKKDGDAGELICFTFSPTPFQMKGGAMEKINGQPIPLV